MISPLVCSFSGTCARLWADYCIHTGGSPSPSFSVAESSHIGHGDTFKSKASSVGPVPVPRMLARTGEPFRFRISLTLARASTAPLEVRLSGASPTSGSATLPRFIKADLAAPPSAHAERRVVEFSGVPAKADVGDLELGVYERGGDVCVGRVVVEVVEAAR